MTKRNEILRNCIKRVESICTNALQSQVEDNDKCERILKNAVKQITQETHRDAINYIIKKEN